MSARRGQRVFLSLGLCKVQLVRRSGKKGGGWEGGKGREKGKAGGGRGSSELCDNSHASTQRNEKEDGACVQAVQHRNVCPTTLAERKEKHVGGGVREGRRRGHATRACKREGDITRSITTAQRRVRRRNTHEYDEARNPQSKKDHQKGRGWAVHHGRPRALCPRRRCCTTAPSSH